MAELIRQAGISEQTFYRWKKHYVGLEVDQVGQLRQVQEENVRLKRLVTELTLDKTMLQDVLAGSLQDCRSFDEGCKIRRRATKIVGDHASL